MTAHRGRPLALLLGCFALVPTLAARGGDRPLGAYFEAETARIANHPPLDINSAEQWSQRRPELKRQLLEMLGLDPMPERTDPRAEVRGVVERPDFVVEKILYQSSPGLYVTANLYRPKVVEKPLPAILYVCGHARVEKDGVIYGNKTSYQRHAEWFAANGYVCLVVDTLQLGEVPGVHHGTYNLGMWWWISKGYTPAGVEVWNGIRGIDYLVSRPEVDPDRLGVTGRSGGGAMSWYLGAVDDRLKAVVPVAGITDLHDHVVAGNPKVAHPEGVVEGHCDCMYFVNTYRWDYSMVAALVAPKALLFVNTDVDPIFPEAGVQRIFKRLETVYGWLNARDRLDLLIGKGGHEDTEEIRHPAFAWFDRWLKDKPSAEIQEPDRTVPIEELKVLEPGKPLPANRNDTIQETFVPTAPAVDPPKTEADWSAMKAGWEKLLAQKVFAGWPDDVPNERLIADRPYAARYEGRTRTDIDKNGLSVTAYEFWAESLPELKLRLWEFHSPNREGKINATELVVMNGDDWKRFEGLISAFEAEGGDPSTHPEFAVVKGKIDGGTRLILFAPRGVGPTAWPKEKDTQIRRRFYLLGQTLEGMRVLDARRALRSVAWPDRPEEPPVTIIGAGDAAPIALWAAIYEPKRVARVVLSNPPATVRDGPAFLNLDRVMTMPQVVSMVYPREVEIIGSPVEAWSWPRTLAENLGAAAPWPTIKPGR